MIAYINPNSIGHVRYEELKLEFPQINFVDSIEASKNADIVLVMPQYFKEVHPRELKNLQWAQLLMAGYDSVDFSGFDKDKVTFTIALDVFSTSIADDVFSKILYFNRNMSHYLESKKTATWSPIRKEPEIYGSTVGILGCGSIGKELAKRFKAFGAKTIGYRTKAGTLDNFDEIVSTRNGLIHLLETSDTVVVALPLNSSTKHLLDKSLLSKMKADSLLINVARGDIIIQNDLIELLQNGHFRGVGLDVTSPEPLPSDNPLWSIERVYLTPHNASSSPYMQQRLKELCVRNLKKYLQNEPLEFVIHP